MKLTYFLKISQLCFWRYPAAHKLHHVYGQTATDLDCIHTPHLRVCRVSMNCHQATKQWFVLTFWLLKSVGIFLKIATENERIILSLGDNLFIDRVKANAPTEWMPYSPMEWMLYSLKEWKPHSLRQSTPFDAIWRWKSPETSPDFLPFFRTGQAMGEKIAKIRDI